MEAIEDLQVAALAEGEIPIPVKKVPGYRADLLEDLPVLHQIREEGCLLRGCLLQPNQGIEKSSIALNRSRTLNSQLHGFKSLDSLAIKATCHLYSLQP